MLINLLATAAASDDVWNTNTKCCAVENGNFVSSYLKEKKIFLLLLSNEVIIQSVWRIEYCPVFVELLKSRERKKNFIRFSVVYSSLLRNA